MGVLYKMKRIIKVFALLLLFTVSCNSNINDRKVNKSALLNEHNASVVNTEFNGSKTIIVYYSWNGNTEIVANKIKKITGADIYKITTKIPYPNEYDDIVAQVKDDIDNDKLPELNGSVDLSKYDNIIIGYPIWIGDMALPMKSFLSKNDLKGKNIAPFILNGGSRVYKSISYIKETCQESKVLNYISIKRKDVSDLDGKINNWIRKIKVDISK